MATVPAQPQNQDEHDHRAMAEVFVWLGEIIDGFDQHAKDYALRYWLFLTGDAPNPSPSGKLHPALAKIVREQVTEQAQLEGTIKRFVR